jgi:serine/threonine protein kinase
MEHLNQIIAKYKLTRFIGEGGMASVYEGTHEKLGTKVAVKILNPVLSANKQIRQRFENEAKFMASLNHPNIVKVIDYDDQTDVLAIIMELLEGQDLDSYN